MAWKRVQGFSKFVSYREYDFPETGDPNIDPEIR